MKNTPTTIQDFKKLSIQSYKDIKKGMTVYDGNVKIEIMSDVYLQKGTTKGLWVDTIKTYEDGFSFKENLPLADRNITNGGYNPWMLFEDKEIAKLHNDTKWLISSSECPFTGEIENEWVEAPIGEILTDEFIIENFEMKELTDRRDI